MIVSSEQHPSWAEAAGHSVLEIQTDIFPCLFYLSEAILNYREAFVCAVCKKGAGLHFRCRICL